MPGCAAPGCTNHSRNGFRMFRFPANAARKAVWLQMSRRDKWLPTRNARLCEVHFEESEYESKRMDGRKLLKQSAVPRIFNISNKSKKLQRRKPPRCLAQQSVSDEQGITSSYIDLTPFGILLQESSALTLKNGYEMDNKANLEEEGKSADRDFPFLSLEGIFENGAISSQHCSEMEHKISIKEELPDERLLCSMDDRNYGSDTTTRNNIEIEHKINIKDEPDTDLIQMKEEIDILDTGLQNERVYFPTGFRNGLKNVTNTCINFEFVHNRDIVSQNEGNCSLEFVKEIKKEFITYNEDCETSTERISTETECQSEVMLDVLQQNENRDGKVEELKLAESSRLCTETVSGDSHSKSPLSSAQDFRKKTGFYTGNDDPECDSLNYATINLAEQHVLSENSVKRNELEKQHKCEICDKCFTRLSSLKMHRLIHEGKKAHRCKICDNNVTQLSHLKQRHLVHEGKKPHKCKICKKSYTRAGFKIHNLIHEGKKPHKCKICDKNFTQSSHLKQHHLIHEGRKPYKCEICNKSFTRMSHLKGHNLIHEGKKSHKCEICDKSFTHLSDFRQHNLIHKGEKPHKCEICDKRFTRLAYLKQHNFIHEGKKRHK